MKSIYLDYAAATPLDPEVLEAMKPYFLDRYQNPSSVYESARSVRRDVEGARKEIAHWLGARPAEVTFVAGGTAGNNLAIHGVMQKYPDGNVVVAATEHESVLEPAKEYDHKIAAVDKTGLVSLDGLKKLIDDSTVLVSIIHAHNEIGTVQSMRDIASLLSEIKASRKATGNTTPLYFHTDACQSTAYLDLHVDKLGVDLMTLNAGKIYGPKHVGCLYIKAGVELKPQIVGGGQEHGLRSGTENVPGIIGFAFAMNKAQENRQEENKRLATLRDKLEKSLSDKLSDSTVNGHKKHRIPNNLNISVPGVDGERLVMELDERGIQIATGAACAASKDEPSHTLLAIGIEAELAQSSVRFSLGKHTTEEDIDYVVEQFVEVVQKMKDMG